MSKAFVESPRCKYELDLALEESLNRGEDGETGVLIPLVLDDCAIPKCLRPLEVLEIQAHETDWLTILVKALESNDKFNSLSYNEIRKDKENDIDNAAMQLCQKLHTASMQEVFTFLSKPIAENLSHFLAQHADLRFFVSAMDTCGIEIKDNKVSVVLRTFSQFTDKPYQIAHCFKQYAHKLSNILQEVTLIIHDPTNVLQRRNGDKTKEFNELVRTVLKPLNGQHWGIMWRMNGIQDKSVRDECRSLIHDAIVEKQEPSIVSHPIYVSLSARVASFDNWPAEKSPTKEKLAEAGYFYDKSNNILRCFYCNGVSWDLKPDEDPWARHAKWYFNCPYVLASKTEQFINRCRFETNRNSDIYNTEYQTTNSRLLSYTKWPIEKCPDPCNMSKAGFYFTNIEDKVVCFHCGYGVRNWKKDDNPWYRHAWWSPNCLYLQRKKSGAFIESVLNDRAKFEPLDKCSITYTIELRETR